MGGSFVSHFLVFSNIELGNATFGCGPSFLDCITFHPIPQEGWYSSSWGVHLGQLLEDNTNFSPILFFFFFLKIFKKLLFFYFTILYWFCHTSTCIHHGCTCVPHPEPPSHLPPYTIPLGYLSAPAPSLSTKLLMEENVKKAVDYFQAGELEVNSVI